MKERDGPVIQTTGLTKRFGTTLAVDEISFQVERGQVFGFLGPNGSGKTTTIGMLLGIITSTSGEFRLFGGSSPAELHAARQRIGATLETPNFYPYLSCRDNLKIVANVKGKGESEIEEVLDIVGLAKRRKTRFKACSLGMKQRLALAATMLGDPELIILDEPANGLPATGSVTGSTDCGCARRPYPLTNVPELAFLCGSGAQTGLPDPELRVRLTNTRGACLKGLPFFLVAKWPRVPARGKAPRES